MRKTTALVAATLLILALMVGSALAGEGGHDHELPRHPHAMLHNFQIVEGQPTFDRCVDLADNRALPLEAHHHSLHTGTAGFGDLDVGITKAGHIVVPLQPFPGSPFADCADIEAFLAS